jgi:hypothetical protein
VALREAVLAVPPQPTGSGTGADSPAVVVFVDEIDAVRSLPFSTDEFFAAIRECYNRRAEDPVLNRLAFCLLGVATPSDLIRDTRTTPFNIGRRIELHDFTAAEAGPCCPDCGLHSAGVRRRRILASAMLARILHWTNGHPYLTQRLCQEIVSPLAATSDPTSRIPGAKARKTPRLSSATAKRRVDEVCRELFLTQRARERDDNLLFVRERLLRSEVDRATLLRLYGRVLRVTSLPLNRLERRFLAAMLGSSWGADVPDEPANPSLSLLRLSGLIRVQDGVLRVRNEIYARAFNAAWVRDQLPDAEVRRHREAFWLGVARTAAWPGDARGGHLPCCSCVEGIPAERRAAGSAECRLRWWTDGRRRLAQRLAAIRGGIETRG